MISHSPGFTGTLCGSKSNNWNTSPTCKRCQVKIKAAVGRARKLIHMTDELGGYVEELGPDTCPHGAPCPLCG